MSVFGPSPADFTRWRVLILDEGMGPHDAAVKVGYRGSSAFRRADPVRHAEILNAWREVRDAPKLPTKEQAA